MGDMGLLKQGWKWLQSHKQAIMGAQMATTCVRDWLTFLIDNNGQSLYNLCLKLGRLLLMLLVQWRDSVLRGSYSLIGLGVTSLFIILWSCFLSLTTMSCLIYVLLILGAAGATIHYLGYTPGLFIVGFFGILTIWIYGNFWMMGMLFVVGGYMFSQNHARPLIFMSMAYSVYYVYTCVGWIGVFLSTNLSFLSNDLFTSLLRGYDCMREHEQCEASTKSEPIAEEFSEDCDFCTQTSEAEDIVSPKACKASGTENSVKMAVDPSPSKVLKSDSSSLDEMKKIMSSSNHYEALGFLRNKMIDLTILKKEYRRKAVLVHPDKNMGNPLASESFKKLQLEWNTVLKNPGVLIVQSVATHIYGYAQIEVKSWLGGVRTVINITKPKMERGGLNWDVQQPFQVLERWRRVLATHMKVEIPRAFVCAESKIFDVSEWAICQGMACKANTHRPSFRVSMVGLDKRMQRSNSAPFPCGLDAEMMSEDEDDFELWYKQALASGIFSETSQRRKSWSPFKISQKNSIMKQLRRFS
ncbi:hypothetical protein Taro_045161 [Colocasia esculenta]|uniref:J domain-containing protein n=1 Tax=Colocasia esculenta TaxID=4460 RepID=A0A843WWD2_COLES|nr:hypothetical protein [Colocasia esculenta]